MRIDDPGCRVTKRLGCASSAMPGSLSFKDEAACCRKQATLVRKTPEKRMLLNLARAFEELELIS